MPNSNNYGVFLFSSSSGWCELDNRNTCGTKEKAELALVYYSSRHDNEFILVKHATDCTKKYPRCCFPLLRFSI